MEIYLLIHEDRHIDVEVTPYSDRHDAIAAAREILQREDGAEEGLTSVMLDDGWIFYGTYSSEDDCVRVVERGLR